MNRRTFLKSLGIGAVGAALGTANYDELLGTSAPAAGADAWSGGDAATSAAQMIYRPIPHTGQQVSVVSLGVGSLHESDDAEITRIVDTALGSGMNLIDMIMPTAGPMEAIARGMKPHRQDTIAQFHLGTSYNLAGVIDRTRDLAETKKSFENDLRVYGTSGSDVAMLHYIDQDDDYERAINNGLLDYAVKLRQEGTIRYIGFSSHSVNICDRFLDTGLIDVFMFSLNPAYDFENTSEGLRVAADRAALYAKAEKLGAAITVMKCYDGGKLLSASDSPFGTALTTAQCVHLLQPLPAVPRQHQHRRRLQILRPREKRRRPRRRALRLALPHASDCIRCGDCEPRCPFHVKIIDGMARVAGDMGR